MPPQRLVLGLCEGYSVLCSVVQFGSVQFISVEEGAGVGIEVEVRGEVRDVLLDVSHCPYFALMSTLTLTLTLPLTRT